MNTDADNKLLADLKASSLGASYDLVMAAHDRLKEVLEQKHDLFMQLISQLDHIDDLEERIRNNS